MLNKSCCALVLNLREALAGIFIIDSWVSLPLTVKILTIIPVLKWGFWVF